MRLKTAFGFGFIRSKKFRQPSEIYPEKMFMPDYLRLPFHTDREAPQVARCDSSKKSSSGQPSEIYPEKMFMPDYLRLPFHTDRKAPQVTRCDSSKKYGSGRPSVFGRSPAKSLSSLRRFTPKKCSCRTTFGCFFPPTARPLK